MPCPRRCTAGLSRINADGLPFQWNLCIDGGPASVRILFEAGVPGSSVEAPGTPDALQSWRRLGRVLKAPGRDASLGRWRALASQTSQGGATFRPGGGSTVVARVQSLLSDLALDAEPNDSALRALPNTVLHAGPGAAPVGRPRLRA